MSLLQLENLSVTFGSFRAVDNISYKVEEGEVLGIVGESGSGKSVSSLSIMGLIDFPGKVSADQLTFDGQDLQAMPEKQRRKLTGSDIAMIFQDPMTSLNPCFTVGYQIIEALKTHQGGSKKELKARAIELLTQVGIPAPESRLENYPHQLSGGMSQRVMIAMSIACDPRLLIADEPTTALDVTIQAQIIDLLIELQRKKQMGLVLITHDLALVAEVAHRVIVMYAGQIVESGPASEVFSTPRHPYTQALLASLPESASGKERLEALPGVVPGQYDRPLGCLLSPRCPYATDHCREVEPANQGDLNRQVKCHTPLDREGRPAA
ncbi:MAG: dipeptide ABC transporter ATP-binding protein [Gammaproteobacteria bacterium]|jgi:dipeptide transport system ATP-binding protein|uniref:dipeptide ABC transporter ATP-binding protein n=1 Tax=Marinomonas polaris TaxID=293552 RepID=UPI001D3E704F|nr:dipeptide ABC transporter ATP-binding protein [Gammaproteobacteria bacterium]MBU1465086.1 dipeptide ABC transporter ATP-binding protein [Gammaproteobacteria bacterium]MBU2022173.1 dipeptide ABC transporter ATP-binding protein [Gammaproteobacteria bacterium]MBU2236493.1 dipeptide ABC transporter ATP-binding protein [Gammaproteobacteria bacterium]MBU2317755.1 dipeptide ABC transporter ATP-binding protein [Gammaproteobacteria bacterium]